MATALFRVQREVLFVVKLEARWQALVLQHQGYRMYAPSALETRVTTLFVTPRAPASDLRVEIIDSVDELLRMDAAWLSLCDHPETHPATFAAVCRANKNLVRPHVVFIKRGEVAVALAVARLQKEPVPVRFGLGTPLSPALRVVRLSYQGITGELSPDVVDLLLKSLIAPVTAGEADAVFFDHLRAGDPIADWIAAPPSSVRRDLSHVRNSTHWAIDLPPTFEEFLARLSRNERQNIRKNRTRVHEELGDRLRIVCYRTEDDKQTLFQATARVAARSYLKALGVSFVDNYWAEPLLESALREGMARCYVAYIDDTPAAFYHGLCWAGTFHGSMTGYDPAFAHYGIGRYVIQHLIADLCVDPDVSCFDFGFGHADYKSRLANRSWTEFDRYVFGRGFRARTVNATRGSVEGIAKASDRAIARLGLRSAVKQMWWRHATKR